MNNSHVDVNMWHNRFSENENKAVGAPIHDTAIPRHRDSKAKKPRHRETETINPRHRDSKTFFQRTKSHDIEIPRPKNHDIEIPRPKSHDIEFLWNSDPYAPWYLEDVLKTPWKRLEGVLKMYGQDIFKTKIRWIYSSWWKRLHQVKTNVCWDCAVYLVVIKR